MSLGVHHSQGYHEDTSLLTEREGATNTSSGHFLRNRLLQFGLRLLARNMKRKKGEALLCPPRRIEFPLEVKHVL